MSKKIVSIVILLFLSSFGLVHAQENRQPCALYPIKVTKNGKAAGGYIDRKGKVVVEPIFSDEVGNFSDGTAIAKTLDPYRLWLIDCRGRTFPIEGATLVEDFSEGLAFARINETNGFIDRTGKMVITLPTELKVDEDAPLAYGFRNGVAGINTVEGVYQIDKKGNLSRREGILGSNGFIGQTESVMMEEGYTLIDRNGNRLAPFEDRDYDFSAEDNYFHVRSKDKKWRYFDQNGNKMLELPYIYSGLFHQGLAAVLSHKNEKWGFINKKGKIVIPAIYESAGDFSEGGLAPVQVNGKSRFINTRGEIVIESAYAEVGDFVDDLIWVQESGVDGKGPWGYIDKSGNWVWKDTP